MSEELTTIATYPQAVLAHAARNFLAEQGIRAFVADEYTTVQSWSNYIEAKLQVAAVDAERATSLLATIKPA
jgi:hypothetical protein